jgi:hypothetical protein
VRESLNTHEFTLSSWYCSLFMRVPTPGTFVLLASGELRLPRLITDDDLVNIQEIEFIWKAPRNMAGFGILLYRYATVAGLIISVKGRCSAMHYSKLIPIVGVAGLSNHLLDLTVGVSRFPIHATIDSPHLSAVCISLPLRSSSRAHIHNPCDFSCKHIVAATCALCVVSLGIADVLVMLRVSVLWGRQRSILITLLVVFLVTYVTTVICFVIASIDLVGTLRFLLSMYQVSPFMHPIDSAAVVPIINLCNPMATTLRVSFGVWIPGVSYYFHAYGVI